MTSTDALGRKLQSVYDALAIGNYRGALKLTTAALSKFRGDHLLRALKAHALERSGRVSEAFQLCEDVRKETPVDPQVLNALQMTYARCSRNQENTDMHLAAAAAAPEDLSLQEALFGCYVREGNLVKQQQLAMRMSKCFGKQPGGERYGWWAVTALLQQARAAADEFSAISSKQLLQLADSLARRQAALMPAGTATSDKQQGLVYTVESLLLHVEVLRDQGRVSDALGLVEAVGEATFPLASDWLSLRASLQAESGNWLEAAALYKEVLQGSPDSWASIVGYLDCMLSHGRVADVDTALERAGIARLSIADNSAAAASDAQLSEAAATVARLQQQCSGQQARGALLAFVELQARCLHRPSAPNSSNSTCALAEAMLKAFVGLSDIASCSFDLRPFVALIADDSRQWLANAIRDEYSRCASSLDVAQDRSKPALERLLCRNVNTCQMEDHLGLPTLSDAAAGLARATALLHDYAKALPLSDGVDPRDRGPGDSLVALAADALLEPHTSHMHGPVDHEGLLRAMLQAVLVLEAGCIRRTVAAPLHLRATALYGLLGACAPAVAAYTALSVKHIQHDTITGHMMLPTVLGLGGSDDWDRRYLTYISDLGDHHHRDVGDSILSAYHSGSYTKVPEFMAFTERLDRSHTRAEAAAEAAVAKLRGAVASASLSAKASSSSQLASIAAAAAMAAGEEHSIQNNEAKLKMMRFNEDLSLRPRWQPPNGSSPRLALTTWWDSVTVWQPFSAANGIRTDNSSSGNNVGSGVRWWQETGAAEGNDAASLRHEQSASLQRRQMLPQLVASLSSVSSHDKSSTARLDHVHHLAASCGLDDVKQLPAVIQAACGQSMPASDGSSGSRRATLERPLELLNLALFCLDERVCSHHSQLSSHQSQDAVAPASTQLQPLLASLQLAFCTICSRLTRRLELQAGASPDGGAIAAAWVLVSEEALWLQVALLGWYSLARPKQPLHTSVSKQKRPRAKEHTVVANGSSRQVSKPGLLGDANSPGRHAESASRVHQNCQSDSQSASGSVMLEPGRPGERQCHSTPQTEAASSSAASEAANQLGHKAPDLAAALVALQDAAVSALKKLGVAVQSRLQQAENDQVAALASCTGMTEEADGGATAVALWGWELRFRPRKVLQDLAASQRDTLRALAKEIGVRVSGLAAIAV